MLCKSRFGAIYFLCLDVAVPNPIKCGVNWLVLMWLVIAWWGRRVWHLSRWRTACVVLYFTDQANSLARSLSLLLTLPLALSSSIKSHWWQIDGIMMVYRVDFSGLFWLSTDPLYLWPRCFSSSLTFHMCDFPLSLFCQVRSSSLAGGGYTQLAWVYFRSKEEVWVGRKCAQLFFLYQPLRFEDLERSAVSCSDRIMRLLKCTLKKNKCFIWERLWVCKREKSRAGKTERRTHSALLL